MLLRFLYGNDIFISYSHEDGILYATRLAEELTGREFDCILDVYEGIAEEQIPRPLLRDLRRSYQMVVVGTRGAAKSRNVALEIKAFPKKGRSLVVIGFDGSVRDAVWEKDIRGIAVPNEASEEAPSPTIVDIIQSSFRFKKRKQRLTIFFRTTLTAVALMLLLLAGSGVWLRLLGRQIEEAQEQIANADVTLTARQKELLQVLAEVRQERENVRQQQRLAQARRAAGDLQAWRNARGYSPPEDVLQAVGVSDVLTEFGLSVEAHTVLAGAIEALPWRANSFRTAAPIEDSVMAGDRLLIASKGSGVVEIWDPRRGGPIGSLPHTETVTSLAASRDGTFAVTLTSDGSAHLWDLAGKAERGTYRCSDGEGVHRGLVRVSREGRYVAVLCGWGDVVQVFESGREGAVGEVRDEQGTLREMQFSKDLNHLAVIWSADYDSAALYDIGQQMASLPINRECFSENQKIRLGAEASMAVSSRVNWEDSAVFHNNNVKVCRLQKSGSRVRQLPHDWSTNEEITSDGRHIATSESSVVRIWTTGRGEQTASVRGPVGQPILSFSPDDRYLAIHWPGELWVVESPSGRLAAAIPAPQEWRLIGWSAAGHMAILEHRPSGQIEAWEVQPIQKAKGMILAGRLGDVGFSSSARELLTVDRYGTPDGLEFSRVQVWSMETGNAVFKEPKEPKMSDPITGGGLSADGTRVAVFTPAYDIEADFDNSGIEVYDVESGEVRERFKAEARLLALVHRPPHRWIGLENRGRETRVTAISAGGTRLLWKVPREARFVSGGRFVTAVDRKGRGRIFDVDRGREIRPSSRLKLHPEMDILRTSGGRHLAAIPEGGATQVADLETGATLLRLPSSAEAVLWNLNGRFLFTAADGVARIWEMPRGIERAQSTYTGQIGAVAFSSDSRLVAFGANGGVTVWAWHTDEVRKKICTILAANRKSPNWSPSLAVTEYQRICGQLRVAGAR